MTLGKNKYYESTMCGTIVCGGKKKCTICNKKHKTIYVADLQWDFNSMDKKEFFSGMTKFMHSLVLKNLQEEKLKKELIEYMTNGWTNWERKNWNEYLEDEVKECFPEVYKFLKE